MKTVWKTIVDKVDKNHHLFIEFTRRRMHFHFVLRLSVGRAKSAITKKVHGERAAIVFPSPRRHHRLLLHIDAALLFLDSFVFLLLEQLAAQLLFVYAVAAVYSFEFEIKNWTHISRDSLKRSKIVDEIKKIKKRQTRCWRFLLLLLLLHRKTSADLLDWFTMKSAYNKTDVMHGVLCVLIFFA